MALNLAALATLAGALVLGLLLLRRYLPRAEAAHAATSSNVCHRCGTPAAALTSFTCPGCGADVREAGVGPPRGHSPLAPFWSVALFTCFYLVAATIVSGVLGNMVPRVRRVSRSVEMRLGSPEIRGVDLYLDARGPASKEPRGTLSGDLYSAGGLVTLEVEMPARRWRLLDRGGAQLAAGDTLDWHVVHRWMEQAGVPVDSQMRLSDAAHIAAELSQLTGTRIDMPPVAGIGPALSLSYSAASGGGMFELPDERALPLTVIGGTVLYLAALWLILAGASARSKRARVGLAPAAVAGGQS